MGISTVVNLPKSHSAVFPDKCVVCGRHTPDSYTRVITGTVGWWMWLTWCFGMPFSVKAPACRSCGWKFQGGRFLRLALAITTMIVAFVVLWPQIQNSVPRGLRRLTMMCLALACMIPQSIFSRFNAAPFDITATTDSVDYEFASEDYAYDFALLNYEAEWVKIDGIEFPILTMAPGTQPK
jgi:hypothetical protein